jgi:cysteine-rich repeat protein
LNTVQIGGAGSFQIRNDQVSLSFNNTYGNFASNTIYKVVISAFNANPLTASNNIWSRAILAVPASYSRAFNQEFSWRFKTKNESCEITRVQVLPINYFADSIHDKTIFTSEPFSSPNSCSQTGERLNPWDISWTWSSSATNVATVTAFTTRGNNPYCTDKCLVRGSSKPTSAKQGTTFANLIPDDAKTASHVTWNGSTLVDAGANLWTTNGTVPQVTNGPGGRNGAGPFTGANYYSLGSGSDVLDFSGDFSICIVFNQPIINAFPGLFGNGDSSGGYEVYTNPGGNFSFQSYNGGAQFNLYTGNSISTSTYNIGCVGRAGSTIISKLNQGTVVTRTTSFMPATWRPARLGNGYLAAPGTQTIYEAWFSSTTPSAALFNSITSQFDQTISSYNNSAAGLTGGGICGNGVVEAGEDCDGPNLGNGCSLNCRFLGTSATCGNGRVDAGEACDPMNPLTATGCSSDCRHLGSSTNLTPGVNKTIDVYTQNFETTIGTEWSLGSILNFNGYRMLAGSMNGFGRQTTTLQVANIPAHTSTTVQFDLAILDTMDGNSVANGPDTIKMVVDNIIRFASDFANPGGNPSQSFPNQTPPIGTGGSNPLTTGAFAVNRYARPVSDSTYHISISFPHSAATMKLAFSSLQTETPGDEGWAIDNIKVTVDNPTGVAVANNGIDTSMCGNGTVGSGEDCDTGITAVNTNPLSAANCSASCLHTGTSLSSLWCYSNQVTYGGFAKADFDAACLSAVSRCGDGITGPDEDVGCEIGGGLRASWCNDNCLVTNLANISARNECTPNSEGCNSHGQRIGSSLLYSNPSSCGDGVVGIGEDTSCESNLTINPRNLADPWALVSGVGLGIASGDPLAQRANIVASTIVGANTVSGSGQFNILCGYHTDAECSVMNSGGVVYGVGSDSCCYAKPVATTYLPQNNASGVCLNTAITVDFNGVISSATLTGTSTTSNIVIARGEVGPACGAGETDVSNLVALNNVDNSFIASGPWYIKIINTIKNFFVELFSFTKVLAAPNYTPNIWCVGSNQGTFSVSETSSTTSRISISLVKPLVGNSHYTVILRDAILSTKGVSIGRSGTNPNITFTFDTDNVLCQIDSVKVTPSSWYFSAPNSNVILTAEAISKRGTIQPIPGIYAWDFVWAPTNSPFVTVSNSNAQTNLIRSQNRNGEVDIRALARLTANAINAETGTVASGASHITVFLCENPWPPRYVGLTPVFPFNDSVINHSGFDLNTNLFNGTQIPAATTGVGDGYFNFSTYYCADNGSTGVFDDLPYLKVAVQYTPASLRVNVGVCEDTGFACTVSDPITSASPDCAASMRCLTTSPLKRFIFTNDKNTDGIGIQVFPNPEHLSSMDWYRAPKVLGGQGFSGNVQATNFGGYEAVSDGNNIYASALNYTDSGNLYDVVYLFSINSDAKPETRKIFEEMVKNFHFNINSALSHNDGYCGINISTPGYVVKCSSDLDCQAGQVCSNQVAKLQRNHQRLVDLKKLDNSLVAYTLANNNVYPYLLASSKVASLDRPSPSIDSIYLAAGTFPSLKTGTYLAGQSVSTWPSWTQIGQQLNIATPVDPINKLAPAGSCADQTTFCTNNVPCGGLAPPPPCGSGPVCSPGSVCQAGKCVVTGEICNNGSNDNANSFTDCDDPACASDPVCLSPGGPATACTLHDPSTGWSTTDRRFSFACNSNSLAYRYISTNDGYLVRARFEDPGVTINNLNAFTNGYDFSDNARFPNLNNWSNITNSGICENVTELSTSNKGTCGDGVINRIDGETCDPAGSKIYDQSSCATGPNATVTTCDSACHWGAPQTVTCLSLAKCGNSLVEPGESCDDGSLNGQYNQCNATCTGRNAAYSGTTGGSPGYCGDGVRNPKYEACDNGTTGPNPNGTACVPSGANCTWCNSTCSELITEVPACVPNCTNNTCGTNGCGGSCGTCAAGSSCQSGSTGMSCIVDGSLGQPCSATSLCLSGLVCSANVCSNPPACTYSCAAGGWSTCLANGTNTCLSIASAPAGCVGTPPASIPGTCTFVCTANWQCPAAQTCVSGTCTAALSCGALVMESNVTNSSLIGGIRSLAVSGNYAYLPDQTTSYLSVINISNSLAPTIVGHFPVLGTNDHYSIDISGNYSYVVNSNNTLTKIDISNPAAPVLVNTLTDPRFSMPHYIKIKGNYAFVGNMLGSVVDVVIVDISGVTPVVVATISDSTILGVPVLSVVGNYLYIVSSQLMIFDISNPLSVRTVGVLSTSLSGAYGLDVVDNIAYVATFSSLELFNISSSTKPAFLGRYLFTIGNQNHMQVKAAGNRAYVVNWGGNLPGEGAIEVVDVSDPMNPTLITHFTDSRLANPWGIDVAVDSSGVTRAYVGSFYSSFSIFNLNCPNAPPTALTCTDYNYTSWSPATCPVSQTQTRTITSGIPAGCSSSAPTSAIPVLSQSCTYSGSAIPLTKIILDGTSGSSSITIPATHQVSVAYTPTTATDKSLTWNVCTTQPTCSVVGTGWTCTCTTTTNSAVYGSVSSNGLYMPPASVPTSPTSIYIMACNLASTLCDWTSIAVSNAGSITCTTFTYNAFGACQVNNTQTRTVATQSPSGCTGGSPVLSQSCTYSGSVTPGAKYVSHSGNDTTGTGSLSAPWRTLTHALPLLVPGDTLYIRGGSSDTNTACTSDGAQGGACWTETASIDGTHSALSWGNGRLPAGTAGNPITIAAYPGETVIIEPPTCGGGAMYFLSSSSGGSSCSYLNFQNLIVDGRNCGSPSSAGEAIRFEPANINSSNDYGPSSLWCHDLNFTGGKVRHGKYVAGIHGHASHVTFDGVEIYENGAHDTGDNNGTGEHDHAIYHIGTAWTFRNNYIHDNIQGFQIWSYVNEDGPAVGSVYVNNDISRGDENPWATQKWGTCNGAVCGARVTNGYRGQISNFNAGGGTGTGDYAIIKCNKIHDTNFDAGISVGGDFGDVPYNNNISNNWIWNNGGGTILNYGNSSNNNTITGNIFSAPLAGQWESCNPGI